MKDDSGVSNAGILVSFAAGGLAGVTVALLLAPRSGRGARRLIRQRIQEGFERGRRTRARIAKKGRQVLEGASNQHGRSREALEPGPDRHRSAEAAGQPEDGARP